MNANNDNQIALPVQKLATLYIYNDRHEVDYAASLSAAYNNNDYVGFKALAFELECPDAALCTVLEHAFVEGRDPYVHVILQTNRLTQQHANMNLDLAAYNGNLVGMAVWISLGANVRHDNDRAFMAAVLGIQPDAITFLKSKGCELNPEMVRMIDCAIKRPDFENALAVRKQLLELRTQACVEHRTPSVF